jgi:putative transcriptional regulator
MSADSASINLTHHFLIAMPGLEDELFGRSVVYMCEHSERGAMGLIINKAADMSLRQLFDKVDLPLRREDLTGRPVLHGGPVHTERGFVLHDPVRMEDPAQDGGSIYASTLTVPGGLEMTTSRDVLEALSSGAGPRRVLITLGYASWGEGQLESELGENSWLTVPASAEIVFDTPLEQRYDKALDLLGLKPWMLSPEGCRTRWRAGPAP